MRTWPPNLKLKTFLLAVVIAASLEYGGRVYWRLHKENIRLEERVLGLEATIIITGAKLARTQSEKDDLARMLEVKKIENAYLSEALRSEQNKNSALSETLRSEEDKNKAFEAQIKDISGTVGILQKLSKTDQELLEKYSKIYFLSENYVPAQLAEINPQYFYDKNDALRIHAGVAPFLEGLLASAARDGIILKIASAYRSFAEQAAVKTGYKFLYGYGANQFSADQGYSEHQLGTTVDLTSPEFNGLSLEFEKSASYKWLLDSAHKFGFILSYPRNNSYYHVEPWHWRFVGVNLATKLHNENKYFYELSQRETDPYLISIFD